MHDDEMVSAIRDLMAHGDLRDDDVAALERADGSVGGAVGVVKEWRAAHGPATEPPSTVLKC